MMIIDAVISYPAAVSLMRRQAVASGDNEGAGWEGQESGGQESGGQGCDVTPVSGCRSSAPHLSVCARAQPRPSCRRCNLQYILNILLKLLGESCLRLAAFSKLPELIINGNIKYSIIQMLFAVYLGRKCNACTLIVLTAEDRCYCPHLLLSIIPLNIE